MANYGIEYADQTRGPGAGGPDVRAIMDSLKAATCGRCRRRPATVARGIRRASAVRCSQCAGDEARVERLARARRRQKFERCSRLERGLGVCGRCRTARATVLIGGSVDGAVRCTRCSEIQHAAARRGRQLVGLRAVVADGDRLRILRLMRAEAGPFRGGHADRAHRPVRQVRAVRRSRRDHRARRVYRGAAARCPVDRREP